MEESTTTKRRLKNPRLWLGLWLLATLWLVGFAAHDIESARGSVNVASSGASQDDVVPELSDRFIGIGATRGGRSPDASIAAGRDRLVILRNSAISIIRKPSGQVPPKVIAEGSVRDFFASVTAASERLTDPVVVFDSLSGRFFVANAANGDCPSPGRCLSHIQIAVSRSPYPETLGNSDWYLRALDRTLERTQTGITATDNQGDFDHIAVVGDKLVIGWQAVAYHVGTGGDPGRGGRIRVVDKRPLLSGVDPDTWFDFVVARQRPRPALIHNPRDLEREQDRVFFDIRQDCSQNRTTWIIGAVTNLSGEPQFAERAVVTPFPCAPASLEAPQPGGGAAIDIVHQATQPVLHDGRLWVARLNDHDFGNGPVTAIHWGEVDVSAWPTAVLLQSGVVGQNSVWHYGVALTVDWVGNMFMTYARSGPEDYLSMNYTGRFVADPAGAIRTGRRLTPPSSTTFVALESGRNRFIDYPWATVDPVDGSVWFAALAPVERAEEDASDLWVGRLAPQGR